ncbi:LuxR C-terminal-related transcriptional regulator [Streptomyces sp. SID8352]|uniref:response regulator transcription factor n=1 Tax=Streptomyces sp. SID8352 TaxID=2690338 RepID=UPI00136ECFA1|nr:LuxR C-terminal-related transcriptional regulator [Streptomyces sp. SID8352]MYU22459.1 HTH domain-containing protein [Streptomyces sp. SID8352]
MPTQPVQPPQPAQPSRPPRPSPPRELTRRQEEVLWLMLTGATADRIAQELGISRATVQTHLRAIYAAFGVRSRAPAVIAAIERGYLPESLDRGWSQDRERVLRALRQAWSPCWVHPAHTPSCAVCVRAATLGHAITLVRDPGAPAHPPPAAGPPGSAAAPRPAPARHLRTPPPPRAAPAAGNGAPR